VALLLDGIHGAAIQLPSHTHVLKRLRVQPVENKAAQAAPYHKLLHEGHDRSAREQYKRS